MREGKVPIVTGGAPDIGGAVALKLDLGAQMSWLIIMKVNSKQMRGGREIQTGGPKALSVKADV
jgi:NAD(P)-dependent dehydrogenase (short-subunit alcohol dehydrogenase family)